MSLITYINIELDKFKENKNFDQIYLLEKINKIIKLKKFTENTLLNYGVTLEQANEIIESLMIENEITCNVEVKCNLYDDFYTLSPNILLCPQCSKSIDSTHETKNVYDVNIDEEKVNTYRTHIYKELSKVFVSRDYHGNLESLISDKEKIIPLIGAGCSLPLKGPSWRKLFEGFTEILPEDVQSTYSRVVNKGKFFEAIECIFEHSKSVRVDDKLKSVACNNIKKEINYEESSLNHNYMDLMEAGFPFYMTTNYDLALSKNGINNTTAIELEDIYDIQSILYNSNSEIIHLHGIIDKPKSIILTKNDYINKYKKNDDYTSKLSVIMGAKSILFLGFSLNDEYFNEMYNYVNDYLKVTNYVITTEITSEKEDQLISRNILPIILNCEPEQIVMAIKYILKRF